MEDLDLLAIGDASLDVFIRPSESETLCQLNDKECLVCFSYGDKIPAKELEFSVGGNAANNAVGVRRLGFKTGIVLSLGDDHIGDQIVEKLIMDKVDTDFIYRQEGTKSDYSTVINYMGERTIFTYKPDRVYETPDELPKSGWIYLTSMGEGYEYVYRKVAEWAQTKPDVKLAFNPGSRQIRAGLEKIANVLKSTYMVYVNRQEAEKISSFGDSQGKEKQLLKEVAGLGPKVIVVTDGGEGSFVYDGERFIKASVLPVDPYERTGAGDAFGSGMLSALMKGKDFKEALLWGTVNSASVIGYTGAQRGLLNEDEMSLWIKRAISSNVKVEEF